MNELLSRGVEEVIGLAELKKALKGPSKLRIKHGIDPTTTDLHLGYAVVYRKLKQFQDLGHQIVILIGDFTGRFGDPTDKEKSRTLRPAAEVKAMAKNYLDQMSKILDMAKVEVRYNSEWWDQISLADFLQIKANFTVQQIIERDMFQKRLSEGKPIGAHEPDYPILQGYDSVKLKSDLTIIGSDQLFNEMQARPLQKAAGQKPQAIMSMKLLVGTDGKQKMSQSLGNYIGLNDQPADMFGKVMSIPDELIAPYYELCTDIAESQINELVKTLAAGANPRDAKASLAREIVRLYHGDQAALAAEQQFNKTFRDKAVPDDIPEIRITAGNKISQDLVAAKMAASLSEARRLISQGGVRVNSRPIAADEVINFKNGDLLQVGKRHFGRIKRT